MVAECVQLGDPRSCVQMGRMWASLTTTIVAQVMRFWAYVCPVSTDKWMVGRLTLTVEVKSVRRAWMHRVVHGTETALLGDAVSVR
jgi:hypothetical protein